MIRRGVLILSADALGAALLGASVELSGHAPHFPRPGEPARGALRRTRADVVLVDCDEELCTEAFIGPALMTGARVILLRGPRSQNDVAELANRLAIPILTLPADVERLAQMLG